MGQDQYILFTCVFCKEEQHYITAWPAHMHGVWERIRLDMARHNEEFHPATAREE